MSEQFRLESLADTAIGLGVIVYTYGRLGLDYGPGDWFILAFAALCGLLIYFSVFLLLTCVSFWVEDRVGIIPPVYNMLAFGRYPLSIYSPAVQFLLSWIVPFGFATFYPSAKLLGHVEYDAYFLALPLVALAFLVMSILLWNRGVRNYSSTGS
jgi:ABC-2 type transport system permease protein